MHIVLFVLDQDWDRYHVWLKHVYDLIEDERDNHREQDEKLSTKQRWHLTWTDVAIQVVFNTSIVVHLSYMCLVVVEW
jgi:hypothetical protein